MQLNYQSEAVSHLIVNKVDGVKMLSEVNVEMLHRKKKSETKCKNAYL